MNSRATTDTRMKLSYSQKKILMALNGIPLLNRFFAFKDSLRAESKTQEYWSKDRFFGDYELELRFFNKPLFILPYRMPFGEVFLKRDNSVFFGLLETLMKEGKIPPLNAQSRVFEPGCNVGGVLQHFHQKWNCEVWGLDLSEEAIEYAQNHVFPGNPKAHFHAGNVLDLPFFSQFSDCHFDLSLCVSHLIHVPNVPEKTAYLKELQRISKAVVLFERLRSPVDISPNKHFMAFEPLGFTLHKTVSKNKGNSLPVALYYSMS